MLFFSDFQLYRLRTGNIIKIIRNTLNLTSRDFAKKTGLTQTDVVLCENGQRSIPEKKLSMFWDKMEKLFPYELYSSYVIDRRLDNNLSPIYRTTIGIKKCLKISMFREKFFKSIIENDYLGKIIHAKLLFRLFIEMSYEYEYGNDKVLLISPKVLSFINYFQNNIDILRAIDLDYIEKYILTNETDIMKYSMHYLHRPIIEHQVIDLLMLLFKSLSINLEDRFIGGNLYRDICAPKKITICWDSGLPFTDEILSNTYHL